MSKAPSTKTLDEYDAFTLEYKVLCGPNTVVWYQNGDFFEVYSADKAITDIDAIASILGIRTTKKNGADKPLSRSNPRMSGVPLYSINNHVVALKEKLYTSVIVSQVQHIPGVITREVTQIIGPGFSMGEEDTTNASNLVISCFFSEFTPLGTNVKALAVGCASADFSTGASTFKEFVSTIDTPLSALSNLKKEIEFKNPNRVILLSDTSMHTQTILDTLTLNRKRILIQNLLGSIPRCNLKEDYQIALLEEVYPNHGICHVFEYLDVDRYPTARVAFCFMITEAKKYNPSLVKCFEVPSKELDANVMHVSPSCIDHLELFDLEEIINTSITKMGKRRYRGRLLKPYTCPDKMEASYNTIEAITPKIEEVMKLLRELPDVENLIRRLKSSCLSTKFFYDFHSSLNIITKLGEATKSIIPLNTGIINIQSLYITKLNTGKEHNTAKNILEKGVCGSTDELIQRFYSLKSELERLMEVINKNCCLKIKGEALISVPKTKWESPKGEFEMEGYDNIVLSKIKTRACTKKTHYRLTHPVIDQICVDIVMLNRKCEEEARKVYLAILEELSNGCAKELADVIAYIAEVDWFVSCAFVSQKRRYTRPRIVPHIKSFLDAKGIRHPVIEIVQNKVQYVTNDIELGRSNVGYLLYGVNGIGKSSMCKSIGIAIIMAQIGMFVACEELTFSPYAKLFMRSPNGDDLKKGASTFTKEALELIEIIDWADASTLVIGDELCSGTETQSAITIVQTGLIILYNRGTSFIFATHMHDLPGLKRIEALCGIKVAHFASKKDGREIIYDRKLKDGQGDSIYGLEICEALGMNKEFMKLAYEIRGEMMDRVVSAQPTKYGNYASTCFCGRVCEETHHITPQEKADDRGFVVVEGVGVMHKNHGSNLTGVCSIHHDQIHAGNIMVEKVQTSSGVKTIVTKKEKEESPDLVQKCFLLKSQGKKQKEICSELSISPYRLKKILTQGS